MLNIETKDNKQLPSRSHISQIYSRGRQCKTPSLDHKNNHTYYYRKKLTITDHSATKKNYQAPRKNASLPKYLPLGTNSNHNKTIRYKSSFDYRKNEGETKTIKIQNSQSKQHKRSFNSHQSKIVIGHKQVDLDTVMNENGKQLKLQFLKGKDLFNQKQYEQALQKFLDVYSIVGGMSLQNCFWIGITYFQLDKFHETIKYLTQVTDKIKNSSVDKAVQCQITQKSYLLLAQAFRKTNNLLCAISVLDKSVKNANSSSQIYFQRARLHVLTKNYKAALSDYNLCVQLNPKNMEAHIERCDMIFQTESIDAAINAYNETLFKTDDENQRMFLVYRKGIMYVQYKFYNEAKKCFQTLTQQKFPKFQSQVNYYKGILKSIDTDYQSALLFFQQAIKCSTSLKFVQQAQFEKIMILMKKKDYYGAQYQLQRIPQEQMNDKIKKISNFLQGIILILKMNIKRGVKRLSEVTPPKGFESISKSFIAYGYYTMREYAKSMLELSSIQGKLCHANIYNQLTLQAILALSGKNYAKCLNLLQKAQKHDPSNNNIPILKALNYIQLYKSGKNRKDKEILLSVQQLLIKAVKFQPQSDFISYFLAAVNYEVGNYQKGLNFIRTAIDVSQDHMIKHYYLKAHLKMAQGLFGEAVNDLTNAIIVAKDLEQSKDDSKLGGNDQIEQKQVAIDQCYLYRALCFIKTGMRDGADQDLRQFFSKYENLQKYLQCLQYFMHIGSSQILLSLYQKVIQKDDIQIKKNKMRCMFFTKQLNSCLIAMKQLAQQTGNQRMQYDYNCLFALKQANNHQAESQKKAAQILIELIQLSLNRKLQGQIFKLADIYFYVGIMLFQIEDYDKARQYFIKSKTLKIQSKTLRPLTGQLDSEETYENSIYSRDQIDYNIGITYLMSGYIINAGEMLNKYQDFQQILKEDNKNKAIKEKSKNSQTEQEIKQITPFLVYNRLCSIFQPIFFGKRSFRLSFCLPQITLKPINYQFSRQILDMISIKDIPMRPNAPWIKKNARGIIFTDSLIKDSIDLNSGRPQNPKEEIGNPMIKKAKRTIQYSDSSSLE